MAASREIIDALESVLSIYFSNVRHRLRASFILCDELVEVTCRAKARQTMPTLGKIYFPQLLALPQVGLDPKKTILGKTVCNTHETRNHMQHSIAAATVDEQHCADAILDAVAVIENCFPGASNTFPDTIKVILRVIYIFSSNGNHSQRNSFEEAMRAYNWRGERERAKVTESIVSPGLRINWGLVIPGEYAIVETILNRVGAP